jgi:lysophospholipase L1-like esterase
MLEKVGPAIGPHWVVIANFWSDVVRADDWRAPPTELRRSALYRVTRQLLSPWLAARKVRWIASREDVHGAHRMPVDRYAAALRDLGERARAMGAEPVYLVLPAPMDLDRVPPPDAVLEYRAAMRAVAEGLGAPLVDGPAAFAAAHATIGHFLDQVHPSPEGHAILGRALAGALVSGGR